MTGAVVFMSALVGGATLNRGRGPLGAIATGTGSRPAGLPFLILSGATSMQPASRFGRGIPLRRVRALLRAGFGEPECPETEEAAEDTSEWMERGPLFWQEGAVAGE